MFRFRISLLLLLPALLPGWAAAQVQVTPQAGLVVLKNGNVLEGHVTEAGEYLRVAFGKSGELRLKTSDVDFVAADLQTAYARKAAGLNDVGARQHLDLAEWCLRQRLNERAAEQIIEAVRIEPEHPRIAAIEARLKSAVASAAVSAKAADTPAPVTEDWDQREKELPRGVVERFASSIQPILFNRCAMNNCHGPGSAADWHITRPATGALAQRRGTQRNLFATLEQLDRRDVDNSPLLAKPLSPEHAGGAIFDRQSRIQWELLALWARSAVGPSEPQAPPSTIVQPATHLSQVAEPKPSAAKESPPPPASDGKFVPRDPFDPEIFNRRMHPDRAPRVQR